MSDDQAYEAFTKRVFDILMDISEQTNKELALHLTACYVEKQWNVHNTDTILMWERTNIPPVVWNMIPTEARLQYRILWAAILPPKVMWPLDYFGLQYEIHHVDLSADYKLMYATK